MKQNFTVRQGALDGVEAFLSVAQHRSFRRAAAELGVTPSAISQAVRALEARIGAAGEFERQHHVLQRRQRGHQMEGLEYEADMLAPQLGEALRRGPGGGLAAD